MTKDEAQHWVGQQLATLRKERGVTQTELAERTGLTQNHITRIESGRYNVGFYQVHAIADALGYDITFSNHQND